MKTIPGPEDSTDRRFGVSLAMGEDFLAIGSSNHFAKSDNPRGVVDIHVMNRPSPGEWGRAARIEVQRESTTHSDQIVAVATHAGTIFASFPGLQNGLIGEGALIDENAYILGSGLRATGFSATSLGTCHFFAKPALDRYADWTERVFTPEEIEVGDGAPDAVVNSLKISNELCYAMGMDPRSPDPAALPRLTLDPSDQRMGFLFQIRPNAADFSWRAVSSNDLATWKNFNGSPNAVSYGFGVQMHFRKAPVSASSPQFFRLEVTPLSP